MVLGRLNPATVVRVSIIMPRLVRSILLSVLSSPLNLLPTQAQFPLQLKLLTLPIPVPVYMVRTYRCLV